MVEHLTFFSMPPGFGFHPTDVELISYYLKRKILGHKAACDVIPDVDIYKHEPWDLPAKSQIPTRDCKWHFFASRDRKYPNGSRSNRATEAGYWKSTGKDRSIRFNNRVIGTKKTLVFHEGKPPYGKRTDWIMHEYYMNESECKTAPSKDAFVLCRVTKRNGLTPEYEVVSTQVEKNISPCEPLPSKSCLKESQDASVCLMPKKELCSPAENLDDFEEWFTELYDPHFFSDAPTEIQSENKVDTSSLDVKHDLEGKSVLPFDVEETDVTLLQEQGFFGDLGYQFNAYEFDDHLFQWSNSIGADAIYTQQFGAEFDVDYLPYPSNASRSIEDEMVTKFPTSSATLSDNLVRLIPEDGEERMTTFIPNFTGQRETVVDSGIKIRARHGRPSDDIPSQRIRLQVNKMESRNPGVMSQTFVFVSENSHVNSTYELNQDATPFKTKAGPVLSGALTDSHQMRADLQETITRDNSSSASISAHVMKPHEITAENNNPDDPSSKVDYERGSGYVSMLSMLHRRKWVKSCNLNKILLKSQDSMRQTNGFRKRIRPLLHKCSSAGLNCLFLATCMTGTATLVTLFLVRDARRF